MDLNEQNDIRIRVIKEYLNMAEKRRVAKNVQYTMSGQCVDEEYYIDKAMIHVNEYLEDYEKI